MIRVRYLKVDEIERLREVDVSEDGDIVYKWSGGEVVAVPEEWARRPWGDEECDRRIRVMREELTSEEIVVLGAFDGGNLVGLATFRAHLSPGMSEFAGLWVTRNHRRQGVATRLAQEVEGLARQAGSTSLYVCASPSRSAVGFYRSRGFCPTLDVNRELYEREPEDIHTGSQPGVNVKQRGNDPRRAGHTGSSHPTASRPPVLP